MELNWASGRGIRVCLSSRGWALGCKTGPVHSGGFGALAAFSCRCRALATRPQWARGPLGPPVPPAGPGAAGAGLLWRGLRPPRLNGGPRLTLRSLFPLFCRLASGAMAQRAFPNPYADYNKSLAEGYFDSAGRVSLGSLPPYLTATPPPRGRRGPRFLWEGRAERPPSPIL